MQNLIRVCIVLFLATFIGSVFADQWVNGYTKKNGTYVQGYMRSSPNSLKYDNFSSKGNTNPYTGKKGYKNHEYSNPYTTKSKKY